MNYIEKSYNGQSFLDKTKKQAKRLFKLAKTNNLSLEIKNLAHAQEVLAKINGYPDWHALEKTISGQIVSERGDSDFFKLPENKDNIFFMTQGEHVISYMRLNEIAQSGQQSFVSYLKTLLGEISFSFNTGFHDLQLLIENKPQNIRAFSSFHFPNQTFIQDKQLSEKLFKIDIPASQSIDFKMTAILVIKTSHELLDEHLNFCQLLTSQKFVSLENILKNSIDFYENNNFLDYLSFEETYKTIVKNETELSLSLFENHFDGEGSIKHEPDDFHKKWIHALSQISKKQFQWKIKINFSNQKIDLFYSKENSLSKQLYFKGLVNTLKNSKHNQYDDMFSYYQQNQVDLWNKGLSFYDNIHENISHYNPDSKLQVFHNTVIYGKPGTGKSVLMNMLNMCKLMYSTPESLPFIGNLDIGPASQGFLEFARASLPENKKYLVQYVIAENNYRFARNPFDTQLGSRFPYKNQLNFLVNFITLLISDGIKPIAGITGFINQVVEQLYSKYSDKKTAKKYDHGINSKIDNTILKNNMKITSETTWWEVVDCLFSKNLISEAKIAQRYAVPVLSDIMSITMDDSITYLYSKVHVESGETLVEYFKRQMNKIINDYPLLSQTTHLDIDEAKIITFDLQKVSKFGNFQNDKFSATMFMYFYGALKSLSINFNNGLEDFNEKMIDSSLLTQYKKYHKRDIFNDSIDSLNLDEIHRIDSFSSIQEQIIYDFKDSRKYNLSMTVGTQSKNTFLDLHEYTTSLFFMDVSHQNTEYFNHFFSLENKPKKELQKGHVKIAHKLITTQGVFEQISSLVLSDHLSAILNSCQEDIWLRNLLIEHVGFEEAINIMANQFPMGAKKFVQNLNSHDSSILTIEEIQDTLYSYIQDYKRRTINDEQDKKLNLFKYHD